MKHIITFKGKEKVKNKEKLGKQIEKHLREWKKSKIIKEFKHFPEIFILVDADEELLKELRNDPDVLDVEEDSDDIYPTAQITEWSHSQGHSDIAGFHSRGYTGAGVKVGYLDTGAAPHEDLVYAGKLNAYPENGVTADHDFDGHGTNVAGIIGAKNNGLGYVGVAPDCQLYGVKVDKNDGGSFVRSAIIDGVDWLVDQGVKIINCSFGSGVDSTALKTSFENAYKNHDVLFIVGAGNEAAGGQYQTNPDPNNCVNYPAKYDFVIAVGTVSYNGALAASSSRGPEIDVSAPGVSVKTTRPSDANKAGTDVLTPSNEYISFSGTSCAAPHVAGLAALYRQMYPNYTADQIRSLIETNVIDYGAPGKDIAYGKGVVVSPWAERNVNRKVFTGTSISGTVAQPEGDFYEYTASTTGNVTFTFTGSGFTPRMEVFDATGKRVGGGNASSPVVASVVAGQKYYIGLYSAINIQAGGAYTITSDVPASGGGSTPGSSFSNAIVVSGTSSSGIIPSGGELYFKYTAPTTGSYTLTLTTSFDSYLELYNSSQTLLTFDDDSNGSGQPKISYNLTAGHVYYLKAFGYNHNTSYYGACSLNVIVPSGSGGTAPTNVKITAQNPSSSQTSIPLTWSASGATSYDVYRNGSRILGGTTATSYTDTGLSANTTYSYYVVATNAYGSTTSATVTGKTAASSGVTPTTIIEDFSDDNMNFNFSGAWVRTDNGLYRGSTANGGVTETAFTVTVPTNATTRSLTMDFRVANASSSAGEKFEVLVNDVVKFTSTQADNTVRNTGLIVLGTGTQTIKIRIANTSGVTYAYIDNVQVSWS